jgi:hypothetical protein
VSLARRLASGEILGFHWRRSLWVPVFQFDLEDLSLRPEPGEVFAELKPAFEGWALAAWFARRNSFLEGRRPVDLLPSSLGAVLQAARADRFVALL